MEWQDIDTAPHDKQFLGCRIEEGKEPVYWVIRGLQLRYDGEENLPGKGYRWNDRGGMYNVKLTHWRPLPAPPDDGMAPASASKNGARVAPSGDSTQLEPEGGRVVGADLPSPPASRGETE